jgi:Uma2 family endonuclease
MIAAGILTSDDPIELLAGLLVPKMPKNPPHRAVTRLTRCALESIIPSGWQVDTQDPITLADSEPEPDVSVVRGQTRDYLKRHPGPSEIGLVVEVADSSLDRDRGLKLAIYARAGVPVYWIVNLVDRRIEVYSRPSAAAYADRRDFSQGDEIPVALDGQEIGRIRVADLLP